MSIQYFLLSLLVASLNLRVAIIGGDQILINRRVNEAQAVVSQAMAFVATYAVGGESVVAPDDPSFSTVSSLSPSPSPQNITIKVTENDMVVVPEKRPFGSYSITIPDEGIYYPGGSLNLTFKVLDDRGNPLSGQAMQIGQRICNCAEASPSDPIYYTDGKGELSFTVYARDPYRNFLQVKIGDKIENGWSSVYVNDMIKIPTVNGQG